MSGGSGRLTDEFSQETVDSVSAALRDGVLVVAGLPNRGTATDFELMTMNGVVNVASVDSQAPIVAGLLALAKERWPDATASQLLQSLIRNTGSEPHELQWSSRLGHGVVNATRLHEEDPAQYPNENPLFKDGQAPTLDEVYSAPEPAAPVAPNAQDGAGPEVLPWVLAGGGVVAVVVAVTLIVVTRRRRGGVGDA